MLTLTIRTDKPEAELGLYADSKQLKYGTWLAHRELAETIHLKLAELLKGQQRDLKDISGIVVFQGPGSFTGLRIGITVANALASGLNVPIVASKGQSWLEDGIKTLKKGHNDHIALPEYGAEPHITPQKH